MAAAGVGRDALAWAVYDLLSERDAQPHRELAARLDRWANARERRNGPGGHGKEGTALLRAAAQALARP